MAFLPPELLGAIIGELGAGSRLASLATIDRQWQQVVESFIWREIGISTKDLDHFRNLFCASSARRQSLKYIRISYDGDFFKRCLEERDGKRDAEHESDDEWLRDCDAAVDESHNEASGNDNDNDEDLHLHFSAFTNEHSRFIKETKSIWVELASWGDDLKITQINLNMKAHSIYELLGCGFRDANVVQTFFSDDAWLQSPDILPLPSLQSVTTLVMQPIGRVDVWPAIVACKIASTLPSLEVLEILGNDEERRWQPMRKLLREILVRQLSGLPSALKTLQILLDDHGLRNQDIKPSNFLVGKLDSLSRTMRFLSHSLTTLAISINYLSSELFWAPKTPFFEAQPFRWPNLGVIDIRTGFETATGKSWMRGPIVLPECLERWCIYDRLDYEDDHCTDEQLFDRDLGYWPLRLFRIRPEPELFDELAISIARAATHMPKLTYLNLEFNASHRDGGQCSTFEHSSGYEGWAFYFRSGNKAKFASTFFLDKWHHPGIDWTDIPRPRTEWVFQCPYNQVEWEEPEEAKALWRRKFPDVDMNLVTLDYKGDVFGNETYERWREGKLICSSAW